MRALRGMLPTPRHHHHAEDAAEAGPTPADRIIELEDEVRFLRSELVQSKLLIAHLSGENEVLRHEIRHPSPSSPRAAHARTMGALLHKIVDPLTLSRSGTEDKQHELDRDDEVPCRESLRYVEEGGHRVQRAHRCIDDAADVERIMKVLSTHKTFRGVDRGKLEAVAASMFAVDFGPGELVIRQGDTNDDLFYIVASGEFSVVIDGDSVADLSPHSPATVKHTYRAGSSFGELALRYGHARKASIRCDVHGTLWALARAEYLKATT